MNSVSLGALTLTDKFNIFLATYFAPLPAVASLFRSTCGTGLTVLPGRGTIEFPPPRNHPSGSIEYPPKVITNVTVEDAELAQKHANDRLWWVLIFDFIKEFCLLTLEELLLLFDMMTFIGQLATEFGLAFGGGDPDVETDLKEAMMHELGSALIVAIFGEEIGSKILNIHEEHREGFEDSAIDKLNNALGTDIGKAVRDMLNLSSASPEEALKELSKIVAFAYCKVVAGMMDGNYYVRPKGFEGEHGRYKDATSDPIPKGTGPAAPQGLSPERSAEWNTAVSDYKNDLIGTDVGMSLSGLLVQLPTFVFHVF